GRASRLRYVPQNEVIARFVVVIKRRCSRDSSPAQRGLRAVPEARSLQWSDLRREGRESYVRMAGGTTRRVVEGAAHALGVTDHPLPGSAASAMAASTTAGLCSTASTENLMV